MKTLISFIKKYTVTLIFILAIIIAPSFFSTSYSEWLAYNLYYCPLYFIFYPFVLKSYWVSVTTYIIITIIGIGILYALLAPDKDKKVNIFSRIFQILAAIIILVLAYFLYSAIIKDAILVYNGQYNIVISDITQVEKMIKKGRRSKNNAYQIKTDLNTPPKKIDLDVYQYKELEKIREEYKSQNIDLEKVKIKIYYLPNSNDAIKYEYYVE